MVIYSDRYLLQLLNTLGKKGKESLKGFYK